MEIQDAKNLVALHNEATAQANHELALIGQQITIKSEEIAALMARANQLSEAVNAMGEGIDEVIRKYVPQFYPVTTDEIADLDAPTSHP